MAPSPARADDEQVPFDHEGYAHLTRWVQGGVVARRQLVDLGASPADLRRLLRRDLTTDPSRRVRRPQRTADVGAASVGRRARPRPRGGPRVGVGPPPPAPQRTRAGGGRAPQPDSQVPGGRASRRRPRRAAAPAQRTTAGAPGARRTRRGAEQDRHRPVLSGARRCLPDASDLGGRHRGRAAVACAGARPSPGGAAAGGPRAGGVLRPGAGVPAPRAPPRAAAGGPAAARPARGARDRSCAMPSTRATVFTWSSTAGRSTTRPAPATATSSATSTPPSPARATCSRSASPTGRSVPAAAPRSRRSRGSCARAGGGALPAVPRVLRRPGLHLVTPGDTRCSPWVGCAGPWPPVMLGACDSVSTS